MWRIALAAVVGVWLVPSVTAVASTPWWTQSNISVSQMARYADTPRWRLDNGLAVENGGRADPNTPSGVQFIAGSGTTPGVAVAAGTSGVWLRDASGEWQRSLILLPQGLLSGPPTVTAVVAFAKPLSDSIYLATDGQGVLITGDGGRSWIRDDLGLPDHVISLSASSSQRTLYALTDQGLWMHHLQALPEPPSYQQHDLLLRWMAILLVTVVAGASGVVVLYRICNRGADTTLSARETR
jgi:hypothetical protein